MTLNNIVVEKIDTKRPPNLLKLAVSMRRPSPSPSPQGSSPSPSPYKRTRVRVLKNMDSSPTRVHCRTRVLHHCEVSDPSADQRAAAAISHE